jgi:hypothetical protein
VARTALQPRGTNMNKTRPLNANNEFAANPKQVIEARVTEWDTDTRILKISNVGIGTTQRAFIPGETIQATEKNKSKNTTEMFDSKLDR